MVMIKEIINRYLTIKYFQLIFSAILSFIIISIPVLKQLKFKKSSSIAYYLDIKSNESNNENNSDKKNETTEFIILQTIFLKQIKHQKLKRIYFKLIFEILNTNLEILIPPPKI
jgi:hypothetical protein